MGPTPQERKEKSIALLKARGIPFLEHLPLIEAEDEVNPRSAEEIARRAIACLLAIQVACDASKDMSEADLDESRKFIWSVAEKFGVDNEFTPREKAFFDGAPDMQSITDMTWKYEAYWPLIWALGLIETLDYPSDICDCDIAIRAVSKCSDFDDFMRHVNLRGTAEILDEADLIYRYHWACVDARINGRDAPAGLHPGVVRERHSGLNWLIGKGVDYYDDWDMVDTST